MACDGIVLWGRKPKKGKSPPARQNALFLSDDWGDTPGGITAINTTLAVALSKHSRVSVSSTVLDELDEIPVLATEHARCNAVNLVSLRKAATEELTRHEICMKFEETPQEWTQTLRRAVPWTTHVIGHVPISGKAALFLRKELYPNSKVVLFIHVIPEELRWLQGKLPFVLPTTDDLVELAQQADVVYSVTKRVFDYFQAKFINRAKLPVDHRLYIPQCPAEVFRVKAAWHADKLKVLVLRRADCLDDWQGVDTAIVALSKVANKIAADKALREATEHAEPHSPAATLPQLFVPTLTVSNGCQDSTTITNDYRPWDNRIEFPALEITTSTCEDMLCDLADHSLCIVPTRAEPFGCVGLQAISAGVPTLVAEGSGLASVIEPLVSDLQPFVVKTTAHASGARLDGQVWAKRILEVIEGAEQAVVRARLLKQELMRDNFSRDKDTLGDFVDYCIGGIGMKFEAARIEFLPNSDKRTNEHQARHCLDDFLLAVLKHAWRVRRHNLACVYKPPDVLSHYRLPIAEIICRVIDKIEEHERRITHVDDVSKTVMVYCPTKKSLNDLWAMCAKIGRALQEVLLEDDDFQVLCKHGLAAASLKAYISGPEYLMYNEKVIAIEEFKNSVTSSYIDKMYTFDDEDEDECDTTETDTARSKCDD